MGKMDSIRKEAEPSMRSQKRRKEDEREEKKGVMRRQLPFVSNDPKVVLYGKVTVYWEGGLNHDGQRRKTPSAE